MVDMHAQLVTEPTRRACQQVLELAQRAGPTIARARQIAQSADYDGQSRYLIGEALTRLGTAVDRAQDVVGNSQKPLPDGFQGEPLLRQAGSALQAIETHMAQAEQIRQEERQLEAHRVRPPRPGVEAQIQAAQRAYEDEIADLNRKIAATHARYGAMIQGLQRELDRW